MLTSSKSLVATLFLLSTIALYGRNLSSRSAQDGAFEQSNVYESTTTSSYGNVAELPDPSNTIAQDRTPRILQATMMFGHNFEGLNERTLQSHAEHATRWGYGNHVLKMAIVGAGEVGGEGVWTKYIFSKILYILKIMTMELEKPRNKRAEWIV